MKLRFVAATVACAVGMVGGNVWAQSQSATVSAAVLEQAKKRFETEFNGIVIDEVSPTPFQDILELRLGNDVLYTNPNVDFVLQGSLVDVKTRTDLTAQRI